MLKLKSGIDGFCRLRYNIGKADSSKPSCLKTKLRREKIKITVKQLVRGAVIAALYAGITIFTEAISFGPVQFRVSEALTLLPFLMPEAVWGLTLGCLIANLFGGTVLDIIFGTLATFLAALITKKIKKLWLTPLPVILCNGIIVGAVITLGTYEFNFSAYAATAFSIAVSETIICYCGGIPLLVGLNQLAKKFKIFK